MKKKLLLFILILLTFSVKISITNAASYVDTEHGVTCKYNLASNAYDLTLFHDGSISQSSTGKIVKKDEKAESLDSEKSEALFMDRQIIFIKRVYIFKSIQKKVNCEP